MNFFEHQERARQRTLLLVILFGIAVGAIIVAVHLAAGLSLALVGAADSFVILDPVVFLIVAAGTIGVVFLGSVSRIASLRSGGAAVATALGGRPVATDTLDADERRLLNVVEEMAIASGCRVPKVFVLENDSGINAFAAGFSPNDAVIGVTRGTLENLDRSELQGVIAHEFSHIFNGDMKLNLRLMGVLFGITMLAQIGLWVFRIFGNVRVGGARRSSSNRRSGGGGGAIIAIFAFAIFLMLIGWIGAFFASLIQAAVSRQREFLADAAAVQYTRDPEGLCRVFRRMLEPRHGTLIASDAAPEASHMFFGDGVKRWFAASPLATHPPLPLRVTRILGPRAEAFLDEKTPERSRPEAAKKKKKPPAAEAAARQLERIAVIAAATGGKEIPFEARAAAAAVGTVAHEKAELARELIAAIPAPLAAAVRSPLGAAAAALLLLLDEEETVRAKQIDFLEMNAPPVMAAEFKRLLPAAEALEPRHRLPLLDLALPSIKRISPAQYHLLRKVIEWFAHADAELSLFEYTLEKILLRRLDPEFGIERPRPAATRTAGAIETETRLLLSVLAHMAHADAAVVQASFTRGMATLGLEGALRPLAECSYDAIDAALARIEGAKPDLRRRLLEAFVATVNTDGRVTVEEAEMLRALADAIDCPLPLHAAAA